MANPSAPDPDIVAEAYRLSLPETRGGEALSTRQIAARLGVSQSAVLRYIARAVQHLPYAELFTRAEQQGDMVTRLTTVLFEAYELAAERRPSAPDDDPAVWLALQDFAAKREAQLAVLLGLNSPSKLAITNGSGNGNGKDYSGDFDQGLARALAHMDEVNARDEAAIRAGRPGVIEGGT